MTDLTLPFLGPERESGSIKVGKQADLVVLDRNLSSKLFSLT